MNSEDVARPVNVRVSFADGTTQRPRLAYAGQLSTGIHVWHAPITGIRAGILNLKADAMPLFTAVTLCNESTHGEDMGRRMFRCPDCAMTIDHPIDAAEGYCHRCDGWTSPPCGSARWDG